MWACVVALFFFFFFVFLPFFNGSNRQRRCCCGVCAYVLLQEDILSIFPIERSQAMEEFEKQIEANKAEHDPIVEIHKVKKKIKDNHQLLKQVMQQLNGNSTFGKRARARSYPSQHCPCYIYVHELIHVCTCAGQTSGIARAALGASTLSIPSWRHDV
jgi:hypothetical protein